MAKVTTIDGVLARMMELDLTNPAIKEIFDSLYDMRLHKQKWHITCGAPVRWRPWCPVCGVVDTEDLRETKTARVTMRTTA